MGKMPRRSNLEEGEDSLPRANLDSRLKRSLSDDGSGGGRVMACGEGVVFGSGKDDEVAGEKWHQVATSFTLGEVESFIHQAMQAAEGAQGRSSAEMDGHSQFHTLNLATVHEGRQGSGEDPSQEDYDGSLGSREYRSQKVSADVQRVVAAFLREHTAVRVGELGPLLWDVLMIVEGNMSGRPRTMAGGKHIFPLPVSGHPMVAAPGTEFLRVVAACLNSMHGVPNSDRGRPSSLRAMKRLQRVLDTSAIMMEPLGDVDFEQLFSVKGVDYQGEEIRLARRVEWESIEASLPEHVGKLDLRDFCEGGVLHYVTHFEEFLLPLHDQTIGKPPRVFVDDCSWEPLARGLLDRGICVRRRLKDLHFVGSKLLLNGLFSVSKGEFKGSVELCRLIMNLKPVNLNTRPLQGDTCTLPMVTQMGAMYLDEGELLVTSSEDLRCYFYLFSVPEAWFKYLGFGKVLPATLIPVEERCDDWVLCSRVLPMGFLNSVAVAQHVHRNVVRRCMGSLHPPVGAEGELRRDRTFSQKSHLFRVYLDNFDELKKMDRRTYELVRGTTSDVVQGLRETYAEAGLPTHPKKSVQQEAQAEVQGAWVDGERGTMSAKPSKVARYVRLVLEVLRLGKASQKELQVVCGGLVYVAMFKRPLLGALNQVWRAIVDMEHLPRSQRVPLKREVMAELVRFVGLVPLAIISFRPPFDDAVTASDASMAGGGFCVSSGLSPYGVAAALSPVRGDIPEAHDFCQVLSIGLFDGIGALRVALDALQVALAGHISVEANPRAQRVVEANFPDALMVEDVQAVDEAMVLKWSLQYSNAGLILVGAGPPCQGVSGLNADRKGALRDSRSSLFSHVPRIAGLCKRFFPWAQVRTLAENVASMDAGDCEVMNRAYGVEPWYVDAGGVSLAHRPRLYWLDWDLCESEGAQLFYGSDGRLPVKGEVVLDCPVDAKLYLEPGAQMMGSKLPTFTTSRPSSVPMRKPAGIRDCQPHELDRWRRDRHRFPPYQYKDMHCILHKGETRPPSVKEREAILGFPVGYTSQCMKKAEQGTVDHEDCRLTLLGNSWNVAVVAWLLVPCSHCSASLSQCG